MPASPDELLLLKLYKQLADTMETLIEIEKMEEEMKTSLDENFVENNDESRSVTYAQKTSRNKETARLFDDADDIKRPDQVSVFVHVDVIRMGEVDTKNQKFQTEIRIISRWLEPQLDRKQKLFSNQSPTEAWDYWEPHLFVENGLAGVVEKATYQVLFDLHGVAMVEEKRVARGFFKTSLDLYDYPFDVQAGCNGWQQMRAICMAYSLLYSKWTAHVGKRQLALLDDNKIDLVLKVGSQRSMREVCFKIDPVFKSTMNTSKFTGHQEWTLDDRIKMAPTTYVDVMKMKRQVKPAMNMFFKTKRRGLYFVWNVIVFLIVVSSLAFSTFSIDCTNLSARLPLTLFLLLSNVTFKFAVTKSLPKISYLTYLDNYVLTSLCIMVVLSMWHTAIATAYKYHQDKKYIVRVDYGAMAVLCVIYIVFNSTFIAKIKYTVRRARKQKEKAARILQEHIRRVTTRL